MDSSSSHDAHPRMSLQERFGKLLHVSTKSDLGSKGRGSGGGQKATIQQVSNFTDFYDLGKEVMPSTHSYMKVLFAVRRRDSHQCVVKVRYKPQCFRSSDDEKSWKRSMELLLNMPDNCGVARIYDILEDSQALYVVMEKVVGTDLFEMLEQEGRVSIEASRDILKQLLEAMAHLHSNNAVHKDLKLENVMVNASSFKSGGVSPGTGPTRKSVKVIDFDTLEEYTPASPTSRDVVGTDQYISQEAYAGRYSPASDIFAVGVIAYRLISGRFPFHDGVFDDEAGENWVGSPKMAQIRRRLKNAKVDFNAKVWLENPMAQELVMRMLSYNEMYRPTAIVALSHAWFTQTQEVRSPSPGDANSALARRIASARSQYEDLFDDGIIVAEESVVGEDRRQALLRT